MEGPDEQTSAGVGELTWSEVLRRLTALVLVGAAAIHFGYAPSHFDEATSHGVFFVVVAWAQLLAALALLRWRDAMWPWLGAAGVSVGVTAVWLVSRTTGLPGDESLEVGLADGLAAGLQVVALLAVLAGLRPGLLRGSPPAFTPLLGVGVAVALVGAVSFSLDPSKGHTHSHSDGEAHEHGDSHDDGHDDGDHEHGDDGHDHGDGSTSETGDDAHEHGGESGDHDHGDESEGVAVAREDRCDIQFNTPTYVAAAAPSAPHSHDDDGSGVDFTVEEWGEIFVQPDHPLSSGLPREVVVDYINDNPGLRDGVLSGGLTHSLEPDPWLPMTDHDECVQLAEELGTTRDVIQRYPTAQDALDDGYTMVTQYYPGIAAHYMKFPLVDGEFDPSQPEMLLYDGDGPDANAVGVSHYVVKEGDEPPEVGFTGPNDHWHRHIGLCIKDGLVIGGTTTTEEECAAEGGQKAGGTGGWMNHVWVVPGCESDWGLFSGANPNLVVRGLDNQEAPDPGCGTGAALDDDLAFDQGGHGPGI